MAILEHLTKNLDFQEQMPLIFVGHGSPMNAIEDNSFSRKWAELGSKLPRPQAILCVSAHWLTSGTFVTAMENPRTIHDFGRFPEELFRQQYPAPGSPEMAETVVRAHHENLIGKDFEWGLDHGTWSVLKPMFPLADIPVIQLSIDYSKPPEYHYNLAKQINRLRKKGVLVMGSGNMVHNLGQLRFDDKIPDWSEQFDGQIAEWIESGDDRSIVNFQELGLLAKMAHPSYDHFLPLLYILGMKSQNEQPEFFNAEFQMGSISMRSVVWK